MPAALPSGFLDKLFTTIDRKDAAGFVDFLTDDAVFQFGSAEPATGRGAIEESVAAFFESIDGLSHSVTRFWKDDSSLVCEGEVCYRRLDGNEVIIPFVNVFECSDGLISAYKIYIDVAPLYAD